MSLCNCVNINLKCLHYPVKHQVNNENFTLMIHVTKCSWKYSITFAVWLIGLIVGLRRLKTKTKGTWDFYISYVVSVMFLNLNAF